MDIYDFIEAYSQILAG
jgi:hypothetical protein